MSETNTSNSSSTSLWEVISNAIGDSALFCHLETTNTNELPTNLGGIFAEALIKTFPGEGYNHDAKLYWGRPSSYYLDSASINASNQFPVESAYNNFIRLCSLKAMLANPAFSFFGTPSRFSSLQPLHLLAVPFVLLLNVVRLVVEFPLRLIEVASYNFLIRSREIFNKTRQNDTSKIIATDEIKRDADNHLIFTLEDRCRQVLAFSGIILGAALCYSFTLARMTIRLVTAPFEAAQTAYHKHKALGVMSGLISIAAYIALVALAPVVATCLFKISGGHGIIADLCVKVKIYTTEGYKNIAKMFSGLACMIMMLIKMMRTRMINKLASTQQHFWSNPSPNPKSNEDKSAQPPLACDL